MTRWNKVRRDDADTRDEQITTAEEARAVLRALDAEAGDDPLDDAQQARWDAATAVLDRAQETEKELRRLVDRGAVERGSGARRTEDRNRYLQQVTDRHDNDTRDWATRSAQIIFDRVNEMGVQRAITSGGLDLPSLFTNDVNVIPSPSRISDTVAKQTVTGNEYSFLQQQSGASDNQAEAVADSGQKPTSAVGVEVVTDRLRIYASLTDPLVNRYFEDFPNVLSWVQSQMAEFLLNAFDADVVSGAVTGAPPSYATENVVGLLNTPGTTQVYQGGDDIFTVARRAVTQMQRLGERGSTSWWISPEDAEVLDLARASNTAPDLGNFLAASPGYAHIFKSEPIVTPSLQPGTALLVDTSQLKIFQKGGTRFDWDPFSNFGTNETVGRIEARLGFGVMRPQSVAEVHFDQGS